MSGSSQLQSPTAADPWPADPGSPAAGPGTAPPGWDGGPQAAAPPSPWNGDPGISWDLWRKSMGNS